MCVLITSVFPVLKYELARSNARNVENEIQAGNAAARDHCVNVVVTLRLNTTECSGGS